MSLTDYTRLHSTESEQSVIGGLLLQDSEAIDRIGALRPAHFFTEAHRVIFSTILAMSAENQPIDVITVAERLDSAGQSEKSGGLAYLGQLAANTPSSKSIRRYADVVIGKAMERSLIFASDEIRSAAMGIGTTREKLNKAQSAVMAITESVEPRSPQTIRDVLTRSVGLLQKRGEGGESGLPTGFSDLDNRLTGGMRPGNLIIVAGRPAMGKTALAVDIAYRVAHERHPALILSMEMGDTELADRLIANAGRVALSAVLAGDMEGDNGDRIMTAVSKLHDLPLIIDEQGGLTMFDVASKARSVKRKHGLSLMVVDYLQLMSGDGDTRNSQIEQITRGMKSLAKELQIPIVLLSQLSRKCEERTNRRPIPSDLRESGAIEQDADVILMVYRDEVYSPDSPDKGTAELIVAKNRQGAIGTVRLAYIGDQTRFEQLSHGWQPAEVERTTKKGRGF